MTILLGLNVFGQKNTFSLTDTTFEVGAIYTIPPLIYNLCIRFGDTFDDNNEQILDSLAFFLNKNENLIIEIRCHTDQRGSIEYNLYSSQKRAENFKIILSEKGVYPNQLISKGYGENDPIFKETTIDKLETIEEKENAYKRNRRLELKILEIK